MSLREEDKIYTPPGKKSPMCYIGSMSKNVKELLHRIEAWPHEDQEELAEFARDIEARRGGAYHATPEELQAIDEALGQVAN
jgi:hypothetical protein